MTLDYRQFKTPYYEITIGDAAWNRKVKLPDHILRLVDKIEMTETMYVPEVNEEPTTLTITFIEGSREPASPDHKLGNKGLYQIASENPLNEKSVDTAIAGSLTNRPGIITDLRFSGSGGITWLTESEKKTGKVDNKAQKNVQDKTTTRKYKQELDQPMFLFNERNIIKVTWGYKENNYKRSASFRIMTIATDFAEAGQPLTTITAYSTLIPLDQIATKKGVPFSKKTVVTRSGHKIEIQEDLKTEDLLKDICKKAGMNCILSDNLPAAQIDKDKQKIWPAGESLTQFLKKLADMHGCVFEIQINPQTGVDTLIFLKRDDFEKRTIIRDKELLYWKSSGSILKRVAITADFGHVGGAAKTGLDEVGDNQSEDTMSNERLLVDENKKSEKPAAVDPTGSNAIPAVKNISEKVANGGTTGKVDNTPVKSKGIVQDRAQVEANNRNRLVTIEFTTLGYPKLTTGIVEIGGIGIRYSGKYRIFRVTHTLNAQGYICTANGTSHTIGAGGVTPLPDTPKTEEDKMTDEQLFKPSNPKTSMNEDPLEKLQKFRGTV